MIIGWIDAIERLKYLGPSWVVLWAELEILILFGYWVGKVIVIKRIAFIIDEPVVICNWLISNARVAAFSGKPVKVYEITGK